MKLIVNTNQKGDALGDLYGIFFEDLNHAADGGLYPELVMNRAFEFDPIDNPGYDHLTGWEPVGEEREVKLRIETGNPVSGKNPHYLSVDILEPGEERGVKNSGFKGGMYLKKDGTYLFSCYAKREQSLEDAVTVSLRDSCGRILTGGSFQVSGSWQKYELKLTVPCEEKGAFLAITAAGRGKLYLDFVSLFPEDTFLGRKNGMRKDIAQLLADMHPKFMRFPGGCLTHDGALDPDVRDAQYRWKNTVGPLKERPARRNNWGYHQTMGLGFFEYFQFCEDIGAKPLPVISPGYDPHHHREAPLDQMQYFVDEALDLIEFANGPQDSKWGALRAEMGHPEPFGMEYLGIGNEEVGEEFFPRFRIVYEAVRERYPEIKVIGTSGPFAAGGEYERGWKHAKADKVDLVDEHFYMSPEWFLANQHRYDGFSEKDPKVFLGEYASWGNTWWNALCEASFMIGMERNAKAVGLACYAPMLCNVNYVNWKPDMIWFDAARSYGSANYYVQKLFMEHQGVETRPVQLLDAPRADCLTQQPERIAGRIELDGDEARVFYQDIVLVNEDTGEKVRFADCTVEEKGNAVFLQETDWINYTLRMRATELSGYRGFRIHFGRRDEKNGYFWCIGGWQNQDTAITESIHGRNSDLSQYLASVEAGRTYELVLKVAGRRIQTFIDGKAYHDVTAAPAVIEPLYAASSVDANGDLLIKVVNVSDQERQVELILEGMEDQSYEAERTTMGGWAKEACNSFEEPALVSPSRKFLTIAGNRTQQHFAAQSITMLRIRL